MKKSIIVTFIILLLSLMYSLTFAHPGGLDSSGGHHVRTAGWGYEVGTYHYHQGPYSGNSTTYEPPETFNFNPPSQSYSTSSYNTTYTYPPTKRKTGSSESTGSSQNSILAKSSNYDYTIFYILGASALAFFLGRKTR